MIYCLLFIQLAALAAYIVVMKKRISREKADAGAEEMPEKKGHVTVLDILVIIAGCITIFFTLFFALLKSAVIYEDWDHFDPEKLSVIEKNSGITMDSHIKPLRYVEKFGGPDGPLHELTFECDLDMETFAEKNCEGRILAYAADGKFYSLNEEETAMELLYEYDGKYNDSYDEYYFIKGRNKVELYKTGDTYTYTYPNWAKLDRQN